MRKYFWPLSERHVGRTNLKKYAKHFLCKYSAHSLSFDTNDLSRSRLILNIFHNQTADIFAKIIHIIGIQSACRNFPVGVPPPHFTFNDNMILACWHDMSYMSKYLQCMTTMAFTYMYCDRQWRCIYSFKKKLLQIKKCIFGWSLIVWCLTSHSILLRSSVHM